MRLVLDRKGRCAMRRILISLCLIAYLLMPLSGTCAAMILESKDGLPRESQSTQQNVVSSVFPMGLEPNQPIPASAIYLLDVESGQTLYEKNADNRIYPASTTKIMTALCVVNAIADLDETEITVQQEVLDLLPSDTISLAGLEVGEKVSVRDLLYCLLLPSGNDAAVILSCYVGGSLDRFIEIMNETALQLGCTSTHFASVNGLSGEEHYSTARDMSRIAMALLKNPDLAKIVKTPKYTLHTNLHNELKLENTNHLLDPEFDYYFPEVTGIKTGSSELSGRCIIASAEKNEMQLLCIIMGAPYLHDNGTIIEPSPALVYGYDLLNWAFSTYSRMDLCRESDTISLNLDKIGDTQVHPAWNVSVILPEQYRGTISQATTGLTELDLPLYKGNTVGQAAYQCGDTVLSIVPLVLNEDISHFAWWLWLLPVPPAALALYAHSMRHRCTKARKHNQPQ